MRSPLRSSARLVLLLAALLAGGAGGCARVTSACESYCDSWCTLRESCGDGSKASCLQSCDPGSSEFCAQAYAALPASCDGLIDGGPGRDLGAADHIAPSDLPGVDTDAPRGDLSSDPPPVDMSNTDAVRCQTSSDCDPGEFCRTDHTCGTTCLSDADCTAGGTAHGVCRPDDMRHVALGCILICQSDADCPTDAQHCTVANGKCSAP
jgi:hypothetical protein